MQRPTRSAASISTATAAASASTCRRSGDPSPNLEFYADGTYTQYKERYGIAFFIGLPKVGDLVSVTPSDRLSLGLAQSATTLNNYTLSSRQAYQNRDRIPIRETWEESGTSTSAPLC